MRGDLHFDEIARGSFLRGELLEHVRRQRIGEVLGELLEGLVSLDGVLVEGVELLAGEYCGGCFDRCHVFVGGWGVGCGFWEKRFATTFPAATPGSLIPACSVF